MKLINFDMLKQPMNWVTVILMVFIFAVVAHLVLRHWQNN